MSERLRFRTATPEDRPWLYRVYEDTMRPYITRLWGWDPGFQAEDFAAVFKTSKTYVLEVDRERAGYVQLDLLPDTTYLRMFILQPDFRSQGLGARVLRALQRVSLTRGAPLTFRVFRINTEAQRFYAREGWRVVAEEDAFLRMAYGGDPGAVDTGPDVELGPLLQP